MAVLEIAIYGESCLRRRAVEIQEITAEIRQFADDMVETCNAANGIGLAAPQVRRLIRMMLIIPFDYDEEEKKHIMHDPIIMINPKLSNPASMCEMDSEGCLSIPGIRGEVERPEAVTVEWIDLEGKPHTQVFTGYTARQVMHENDHLNGVLFIDRMQGKERRMLEPKLHAVKRSASKKK